MGTQKFCGSCGSPVSGESRFCIECGVALDGTASTESVGHSTPSTQTVKPKKEKPLTVFVVWAGMALLASPVIIGAFFLLSSWFAGEDEEETPPQTSSQPVEQVEERPSDISATDCTSIEKNTTAVIFTFNEGESTPAEVMLILDHTANEFEGIASSYSGSERDWLLKMAELSVSLSEFVNTGAGDGGLVFDQLMNNYALVDQFCG